MFIVKTCRTNKTTPQLDWTERTIVLSPFRWCIETPKDKNILLMVQKSGVQSPVEVASVSHCLQGFTHRSWLFGISSINSFLMFFILARPGTSMIRTHPFPKKSLVRLLLLLLRLLPCCLGGLHLCKKKTDRKFRRHPENQPTNKKNHLDLDEEMASLWSETPMRPKMFCFFSFGVLRLQILPKNHQSQPETYPNSCRVKRRCVCFHFKFDP